MSGSRNNYVFEHKQDKFMLRNYKNPFNCLLHTIVVFVTFTPPQFKFVYLILNVVS